MLPLAALPVAPIVGSAVLGSAAFLGIRKARRDERAFFSMRWADVDADEDGEACTLIGEETVPNGKTWWVCNEKSEAPGMECSPVTDANDDDGNGNYLCKQQKPGSAKCVLDHRATPHRDLPLCYRGAHSVVCAAYIRRTLLKFWGA